MDEVISASNCKILMMYGTKKVALAKGLGKDETEVLYERVLLALKGA